MSLTLVTAFHFLGVITNYISIIMVILGNLQQRMLSNYSVIFLYLCSGAHSEAWDHFDLDASSPGISQMLT